MEAETGAVLYAKGMDAQRYPASLTKIMTALLLVENCGMDQQITMTETGLSEAYPGSSNQPGFGRSIYSGAVSADDPYKIRQ